MDSATQAKLTQALGPETADIVIRFLGSDGSLCALVEAADQADMDWPAWGKAAAVLQLWLEAHQRSANATRKLGYLTCTAEAQKNLPVSLRPAFPDAVESMLAQFGFAE